MTDPKDSEKFKRGEAQKRFDAALRGGLSTPPKPLKDITRKGGESRKAKKTK